MYLGFPDPNTYKARKTQQGENWHHRDYPQIGQQHDIVLKQARNAKKTNDTIFKEPQGCPSGQDGFRIRVSNWIRVYHHNCFGALGYLAGDNVCQRSSLCTAKVLGPTVVQLASVAPHKVGP